MQCDARGAVTQDAAAVARGWTAAKMRVVVLEALDRSLVMGVAYEAIRSPVVVIFDIFEERVI